MALRGSQNSSKKKSESVATVVCREHLVSGLMQEPRSLSPWDHLEKVEEKICSAVQEVIDG
jgi:hypothetical protein